MLKYAHTIDGTPIAEVARCSEKRVTLICDLCGRESETSFANYYRAQVDGKTKCRHCATIISGKSRQGKPAWNKGVPNKRGMFSPMWKGGRYLDAHGYVQVLIPGAKTDKPNGWARYIKEHVLVVQASIGRQLEPNEVVHHIDGAKSNNLIENLFLCSHNEHRDAHQSLQEIGYQLIRHNLIIFCRKTKQYMAHDKLRELLEYLEVGNQQPSLSGNTLEGSTTRRESQEDNKSPKSAGHSNE